MQAQTVRHILLHCPNLDHLRPRLIQAARCEDLRRILTRKESAREAARMLIYSGLLAQFRLANNIDKEERPREELPTLDY